MKDPLQKSVICLKKQTSKMLRLTNLKFSKLGVGTNVCVSILEVDSVIYLQLLFRVKTTCINCVNQFKFGNIYLILHNRYPNV